MRAVLSLAVLSFFLVTACQRAPLEPRAQSESADQSFEQARNAPPFSTREPEVYQAKIIFAFKFDETAENFVEQTYSVARDGENRRLNFEIAGKKITSLQTSDGKRFVLLPARKVYAEIGGASGENLTNIVPEEYSLGHLLHVKPAEAVFQPVGAEEIAARQTVKYRVDYGAIQQSETTLTETYVWADENLGFPVRTEIVSILDGKPSGAKSVVEVREIQTSVDSGVFALPKDYRKISPQEIQKLIRQH